MDSIDGFCDRKHGRRPVTYYDERLRPLLEETYGAIVYQEQVMRISMEMSGFSAAKADKLRKAMGKKDARVMAGLKKDFVEGAVANSYDPRTVERLWDDIEKFAQYAFNKSHAAAYAMISYQTAYLKAHYPREYMAAVLSSYSGKTSEIVRYVAACKRGGIPVLPPDVNSSGADFTAVEEGHPLRALRACATSETPSSRRSSRSATRAGRSPPSRTSACVWTRRCSTSGPSSRSSRPVPSTPPATRASTSWR